MTVDDVVYSIDEIWKKYAAASAMTDLPASGADGDTVVVKFSKPVPEFFFSSLLCGNVNYIVPKHVYAGSDPVAIPNNAPIATGPLEVQGMGARQPLRVCPQRPYWRPDIPYMDPDHPATCAIPASRAAAMEAGDIHIGVFNRWHRRHQAPDGTGKFVATPKGYEESVWSTSFGVNMRNPIFAKRGCGRRCSSPSTATLIAKTVYYGYARPGTGPIFSPNKEFFTADDLQTVFDPKKAAAARRRGLSEAEGRQALHLEPAGGRLVR